MYRQNSASSTCCVFFRKCMIECMSFSTAQTMLFRLVRLFLYQPVYVKENSYFVLGQWSKEKMAFG